MKQTLLIILSVIAFYGCNKGSTPAPTSAPLQIVVSLNAATSFSMSIKNQDNDAVFNITDAFGNTTYVSNQVNSGDKLSIHFSFNATSNDAEAGIGQLHILFKGKTIGDANGVFINGQDMTITVP